MSAKNAASDADEERDTAGDGVGTAEALPDGGGIDDGDADVGGQGTDVDEVEVLPWWRNPWNVVALVLGSLAMAGLLGFVIGEASATPDPNAVDIGFLQDMRTHHEQAVAMGNIYLSKSGTDPNLAIIAQEIVVDQSVEVGRMIQLLRQYGKPEANQTDTAMSWMDEPVPSDRMPGMATDSDLDALSRAQGADADRIFANLMIAHHQGGIHMAQFAAEHAAEKEVRDFAKSMISGQQSEIYELQKILGGQ
jgi:uncharacterized protein (DUF305 family)